MAPVATITSNILSSNKIQNGDTLIPANRGPPGKRPLKQARECLPHTHKISLKSVHSYELSRSDTLQTQTDR